MNQRKWLAAAVMLVGITGLAVSGAAQPADDAEAKRLPYCVVDTGQKRIFSDSGQLRQPPGPGQPFFGQDGFYAGPQPSYRDNGDGTVSDLNTGLMWVKARGEKITWKQAVDAARRCRVGAHSDWRMPTIKELYSLIDFNGACRRDPADSIPYIDTRFFDFKYGDTTRGERLIDCQDWSATTYVGTTMGGDPTAFGVNFADGRIKGYPKSNPRGEHSLFVRYVRGNPAYGKNDFLDNRDGTITDRATGLMWTKADSGRGLDWAAALAWAQDKNRQRHLGHDDWRLPNAKELQSIVNYDRAPQANRSAQRGPAIDPIFDISRLSDGEFPFFWTSTTHLDGPIDRQGQAGIYVAFGRALGYMQVPPARGQRRLLDVHGAGAQRSDPKSGDPAKFAGGRGPQGDVVRIFNYVRLVRNVQPDAVRRVEPDVTPLPMPRPPRR